MTFYRVVATQETREKVSGKILDLLNINGRYTIPELSENIGVSTRTFERHLQILQKDERIRRVGPVRGGRWEVIKNEN